VRLEAKRIDATRPRRRKTGAGARAAQACPKAAFQSRRRAVPPPSRQRRALRSSRHARLDSVSGDAVRGQSYRSRRSALCCIFAITARNRAGTPRLMN